MGPGAKKPSFGGRKVVHSNGLRPLPPTPRELFRLSSIGHIVVWETQISFRIALSEPKVIENLPSEQIFVSKVLPKTKLLLQSYPKSSPESPKSSSEHTEGALRRPELIPGTPSPPSRQPDGSTRDLQKPMFSLRKTLLSHFRRPTGAKRPKARPEKPIRTL